MKNQQIPSIKQQVYDNIINDFIADKFEMGDIITEKALSDRYSVSRVSVREALIELCKDNYFRSIPRLGYTPVTYTIKDMMDILNFRLDLELSNLKRVFNGISVDKIKEKGEAFINGYPHPIGKGNMIDHWHANNAFHLDLCSLSGNKYTYEELKKSLNISLPFFKAFYKNTWTPTYTGINSESHKIIITSLLNLDYETTYKALENDLKGVELSTMGYITQQHNI